MNIGVVPILNRDGGGVYQYGNTMLSELSRLAPDRAETCVILATEPPGAETDAWSWTGFPTYPIEPPSVSSSLIRVLSNPSSNAPHLRLWRYARRCALHSHQRLRTSRSLSEPSAIDVVRHRRHLASWFTKLDISYLLLTMPSPLGFESSTRFIMPIHDLEHRLHPEFPEVSAAGEWLRREYLFRNAARHALLLLADSEVGKEDILRFYGDYGITEDRVAVLPFLPAHYLDSNVSQSECNRVRDAYHLPDRYLFYPAQFWPHKNHGRILHALRRIRSQYNVVIPMVFSGTHSGLIREQVYSDILRLVDSLGLFDQVHFLGYIPDSDMSAVYAGASGLVMPTFFGPTNIPVLEAWAFGCPVLTSDIRGVREQAGSAAVLVDPHSVDSIAEGCYRLWSEEGMQRRLALLGRERLASYTPTDYRTRLAAILDDAKARIMTVPHAATYG